MRTAIMVLGIASSLSVAPVASAADIFTPPLSRGGATSVNCRVLNTGSSTLHNVTISLHDNAGTEQASVTAANVPGGVTASVDDATPSLIVYCRVHGISANRARVSLCLLDITGTPLQCTTAP